MSFQTLEAGDLFERSYAVWLRKHLPEYETIWAQYVGNNGNSHPLEMDGLDAEAQHDRKMFCQAHYSVGLFAHRLFDVADRGATATRKSKAEGTSRLCDAYLRDTENITLFLALLGQVCDMIEEIARSLNDNPIAKKVNDLLKERNNAIHAARIPMGEDYVGVKIAIIERDATKDGGYKNRIPWDAVDVTQFQDFAGWLEGTRDELFNVLRNPVYPMIEKAAHRRFGGRTVTPQPVKAPSSMRSVYDVPSAPSYSVYSPPSGFAGKSGRSDISGRK